MRALLAAVLLLGLAACAPVMESDRPLLTSGEGAPRAGLWALLEGDCAAPASAAVHAWPECATPIWLTGDGVTLLMPAPTKAALVLADGAPRIAQLGFKDRETGELGYSYFAVEPEGPAPFSRARVWRIDCPEEVDVQDEDPCRADSAAELRRAAAASVRDRPLAAVWIAPAG